MARRLHTESLTGTLKAPNAKPQVDHAQTNLLELQASIAKGALGAYTTNDVIIWEGVSIVLSTTTVSNDTATWTAGTIFYNGEFYQVASGSVVKTGSNVFVFKIVDTLTQSIFSDGLSHDWIETKTVTIAQQATGTGIGDYGSGTVKRYSDILNGIWTDLSSGLINSYTITGSSSRFIRYKKDIYGNVTIQGRVLAPGGSPASSFLSLPAAIQVNSQVGGTSTYWFPSHCLSPSALEYTISMSQTGLGILMDSQTSPANITANSEFTFMFSYSVY